MLLPLQHIKHFCFQGDDFKETGISSSKHSLIEEGVSSQKKECIVHYQNNEGKRFKKTFSSESYATFKELIPKKEYKYIEHQNTASHTNGSSSSAAKEIREFSKLRDDGIITEEEFQAKKKILLGI